MLPRTSILDGLSLPVLEARLLSLQTAALELQAGAKLAQATYTQGDGTKSVTYTQANVADLTQAILTVQRQIDLLNGMRINRRAPLRPLF